MSNQLVSKPGEVEFSKGLAGVIAAESVKSYVDGMKGRLYYHGYPIEELAENSTYEETFFLLLYDRLPTAEELAMLKHRMRQYRELPKEVYELIRTVAPGYLANPMAVLRTALSMTALYDEAAEEDTYLAHEREAIKITSRLATTVAAIERARKGLPFVQPNPELSHAANFLYMLTGEEPDPFYAKLMDVILITHADHGCNASTFTCIVVKSSMADVYSAVVAALGSLKGPLHGGANQRVMKMLKEIGSLDNVDPWLDDAVAKKKKIMGFGHRVYKAMDPRAVILHDYAKKITKRAGTEEWLQMAEKIEAYIIEKLGQKGIWPNVDFFSGVVMSSMGIDSDLFTPIFAVSRVGGWMAHALEQNKDNRIFRPRFVYTGPELQKYVPIEEREG